MPRHELIERNGIPIGARSETVRRQKGIPGIVTIHGTAEGMRQPPKNRDILHQPAERFENLGQPVILSFTGGKPTPLPGRVIVLGNRNPVGEHDAGEAARQFLRGGLGLICQSHSFQPGQGQGNSGSSQHRSAIEFKTIHWPKNGGKAP